MDPEGPTDNDKGDGAEGHSKVPLLVRRRPAPMRRPARGGPRLPREGNRPPEGLTPPR